MSLDSAPPTPEQLIRNIAGGDRGSFVALFAMFAPKVKSYLLRARLSPAQAEDLTQEAMLKVWRRAGQFDERRGSAGAWLFTIVRNVRVDAVRRETHADDLTHPGFDASEPTPEELCLARERQTRLRTAMRKLSPAQAAVFTSALMRGGSLQQVSESLGLSLPTTKSHLHRAVVRLRQALQGAE